MLRLLCLAAIFCGYTANAGYTSFFYSSLPAPAQPNYYQAAETLQQPLYQAYSQYTPTPTFGGYHQVPAVQYYTPPAVSFHQQQEQFLMNNTTEETIGMSPSPSKDERESLLIPNDPIDKDSFNQLPDNFRGFAYRNEYENAHSHVVFITGPEIQQYRQSFASRTSASDAVDTVAAKASETNENHSLDALVNYLQHPHVGEQRFYSINNALVARRIEDEIPALSVHQSQRLQPISPLLDLFRNSFERDTEASSKLIYVPREDAENSEKEASASHIESITSKQDTPINENTEDSKDKIEDDKDDSIAKIETSSEKEMEEESKKEENDQGITSTTESQVTTISTTEVPTSTSTVSTTTTEQENVDSDEKSTTTLQPIVVE